jgi:hypothetical protein
VTIRDLIGARELDSRSSGGLTVTLSWNPADNSAWISVQDATTGDAFRLDVRSGDRALDLLRHPYAHGVARRTAGARRTGPAGARPRRRA